MKTDMNSPAGCRRRLVSATYEGEGRACKEHLEGSPLAVYDYSPRTEEVARIVAHHQDLACTPGAFYVMDALSVEGRLLEWRSALPGVRPFFPLRCNDDPLLLQMLVAQENCNLVACSLAELDRALSIVPAGRVIYHAPLLTRKMCKLISSLPEPLYALVVDSEETAIDMVDLNPFQPLILRVTLSPDADRVELALGMPVEEVIEAVPRILTAGIPLLGISVQLLEDGDILGDGQESTVTRADQLVQLVQGLRGCRLSVLDIGGGQRPSTLGPVACLLDVVLSACELHSFEVMATPGRFFASAAFSLVTAVTGKRAVDAARISHPREDGKGFIYQTNESIYSAFGQALYGEMESNATPLFDDDDDSGTEEAGDVLHASAILGSTLYPLDVPQRRARLPCLSVGKWLLWKEMGAYGAREEDDVPVYYFTERAHWERIKGGSCSSSDSGCNSDVPSDCDTETDGDYDDDDMTECFGRVFSY